MNKTLILQKALLVLVSVLAFQLPEVALAEGVKHKDDEQKVIESTHHWYVHMMSASDHANAPAKQPAPHHEVFALAETPYHKLGMALEEIGYTEFFVKTVFRTLPPFTSTLNFGVPVYKRTNRFVESQSGPHPIHTDNGTLRKI